ncbi:glycosyltransferase [Chloroflexota bacterium]
MKILEVSNLFSPLHGGSAEVPYRLSRELARKGHQVAVYTSNFKLQREYLALDPRIDFHAFKTWLSPAAFQVTPGLINGIKRKIKDTDIIHLHNYRTFQNIIVHHYTGKYGVPYVLQAHGSLPRIISRKVLKQVYDNLWGYRLLKDAARVIAVTPAEAEQYRGMGISENKIEIVPHGVDLAEFADLPQRGEFRSKYGLDSDQRIVLYLGRVHEIKGLDILAQAFADLAENMSDTRLVIAGPDDGYLSALKKLTADLGIADRVLFTGPLYGQEKLKAYVDADVYVLPSVYEIFGITVLEACACGTPVIVTDCCGIAGAIDGQAGLVIPHDKDRLLDALQHLLNDDKLRQKFGERGKALVQEKFDWEKIAGQVERIYQDIL